MFRKISISALFFLALSLNAQVVSDDQIIETAKAFVNGYLGSSAHQISGVRHLAGDDTGEICVIDLVPGGWLLMSCDYSALPVLAFSLTGTFTEPPDSEYDNRNAFLGEYLKQLETPVIQKSSAPDPRWDPAYYYMKSSPAGSAEATVQPIIKVTWNQGSGWNKFCPADADGPGGHVYAGCVAVSMAQAMSVYGVPEHGKGEKQYDHPVYGSIYANFGTATYDWANMKLAIPDDNNALILFHCAVSVDMDFSPDGSGTLTSAAASTALKEFFFYSKKIAFTKRLANTDEWKALLDKNLLAGRPIIYSGFPPTGTIGHAFNVDGVFKSNYYHLNWGWTGVNDGYYTLDNLKPGTSDFTTNHTAILGIQPFYYPTDVALSDTLVLLGNPAGKAVGKFTVVDEATDNAYEISLECDSTLSGTDWVPDYYLDGDSLRAARPFERADGPVDTVTFLVSDSHGNSIRATRLLLLTASLSADDGRADDSFTLFPVPFTDHLTMTLPPETRRITVSDIRGTEVINTVPASLRLTLPVSELSPGIYIVTITTSGGRHYSRTAVKTRGPVF
jgi:hypothetical protein